jgi:hypothetical protein
MISRHAYFAGSHGYGFSGSTGLFEASSLMQLVGKINRDADYEYSGTTRNDGQSKEETDGIIAGPQAD